LPGCKVQVLAGFIDYCEVDRRLNHKTAVNHKRRIERILEFCGAGNGGGVSTASIRAFLRTLNVGHANNFVKSLRVYFRDYMKQGYLVDTFRIVQADASPPRLFTKAELRAFYLALGFPAERALFLLYATSGRRRLEILNLRLPDLDLANLVIMPNSQSQTKHTWYSFFNRECAGALSEYFKMRADRFGTGRVFILPSYKRDRLFAGARQKTGLKITPRVLRFWFANEMARLGVQDRFIDAFQGRVPRKVLARHYTDYSMETLKRIYDTAGLKVLE